MDYDDDDKQERLTFLLRSFVAKVPCRQEEPLFVAGLVVEEVLDIEYTGEEDSLLHIEGYGKGEKLE